MARARKTTPITFETARLLALALPGVDEGTSYGTPAFRVRGKLFVRLHDSGESLVVRMDEDERAMRMRAEPQTYHITDHYLSYPWVLVRLSSITTEDLGELLEDAWRRCAPARLIAARDEAKS